MERYPMKLLPYISQTVWGGSRLFAEYGIRRPQGAQNCAEAWMLSAHPRGSSTVANGVYAGQPLSALMPELPVLVKLIDAMDDLSVQVHPRGDSPCLLPGEAEKNECWYILDAQPGAALYLGFRQALTRQAFAQAIQNGTLMELVQPVEVQAGEFYFIPAGTLHAIGKGVLLAEVQQSSDTTYRVFDYGRGRALHLAQALEVTDLTPYHGGTQLPLHCPWFSVALHSACFSADAGAATVSLLVLEGEGLLRWAQGALPFCKGESLLLPAGLGSCQCEGNFRILRTSAT